MSKTVKIVLAGLIVLVLGAGLVYTGIWIGRYGFNPLADRWGPSSLSMVSGWGGGTCGGSNYSGGYGMMGGVFDQDVAVEPPSIHEVEDILNGYLEDAADPDLVVSEIMVFDNHAYAQVVEESTGIGAIEVLVDYQTKGVFPEQGPNMIWNLKYGHMTGRGTFRGPGMMMRSGAVQPYRDVDLEDFGEMPISVPEALSAAQEYLDRYSPGYQVDDHAVRFYGYYTMHVLDGSDVTGMLSVNGYTGQVFYHHWHGELLKTDDH